jgi:hypoxanthine phosphoribosyltransferase
MPELIPVLEKEAIAATVAALGAQISSDFKGREVILIGVLKGAFIFLSDLARQISIPVRLDFIRASSYGSETTSSGTIRLTQKPQIDVRGKPVVLVEDIVDTGLTLTYLIHYLNGLNPSTVKVCAMIDKPERRKVQVVVDYVGQVIPRGFLVGYGLDHDERYRELPAIYAIQL